MAHYKQCNDTFIYSGQLTSRVIVSCVDINSAATVITLFVWFYKTLSQYIFLLCLNVTFLHHLMRNICLLSEISIKKENQ